MEEKESQVDKLINEYKKRVNDPTSYLLHPHYRYLIQLLTTEKNYGTN